VKVDLNEVEEAAKELYIRALKLLPPDVKQGFDALSRSETDAGAKRMLGTMIRNISVAEDTGSRSTVSGSRTPSGAAAPARRASIRFAPPSSIRPRG
jgi:hypothetical protein